MIRNVALLQKTMQYIKDHPYAHDQWMIINPGPYYEDCSAFECGSTACFIGWAALLAGWTTRQVDACETPIRSIGVDILGLTRQEAGILFYGGNTVDDLELMVKELVDGNEIQFF